MSERRGNTMKKHYPRTRPLHLPMFAVIVAAAVLLASGCATTGGAGKPGKYSTPFGTWVNTEYSSLPKRAAKIVYHDDGIWEAYKCSWSTSPCYCGTISIWKQWSGKNGSRFYQVTTNQQGIQCFVYELWRLNKAGTKLEGVWKVGEAPSELDTADQTYTVYYRQDGSLRPDVSGPDRLDGSQVTPRSPVSSL
jgi:hypothetical protein